MTRIFIKTIKSCEDCPALYFRWDDEGAIQHELRPLEEEDVKVVGVCHYDEKEKGKDIPHIDEIPDFCPLEEAPLKGNFPEKLHWEFWYEPEEK